MFKIRLQREIDNATFYFLNSSKALKALYLSFDWFNDSQTREFELVAREFELTIREFELVTRGFELALLTFNSCF